jgi:tetratricopeptide (TPR) repeat protein
VESLAERARVAEAKVREITRVRQSEPPKPLTFKMGSLPSLTRIVFNVPVDVPVTLKKEGDVAIFGVNAPYTLSSPELKRELPDTVIAVETDASGDQLRVAFALAPDTSIKGFREDDTYVLDIGKNDKSWVSPETGLSMAGGAFREGLNANQNNVMNQNQKRHPVVTQNPQNMDQSRDAAALPDKPLPKRDPRQDMASKITNVDDFRRITPRLDTFGKAGLKITFPFSNRTAAAAFERDGIVTLVFETRQQVDSIAVASTSGGVLSSLEAGYQKGSARVRIGVNKPSFMRLIPEGTSWVMTLGDETLGLSEPLSVTRSVDIDGRTVIQIPLTDVSGVHWMIDETTGDRLAVATAYPPARGVARPYNFVEFRILPSAHGAVIVADAEDVGVRTHPDGLHILRDRGLSLSLANVDPALKVNQELQLQPVVERDVWNMLKARNIRERSRELLDISADAARRVKNLARFNLAKLLVANNLSAEANGVFRVMLSEEPALSKERNVTIWSAISDIQMNRDIAASRKLSAETLADDPEAVLWRAVIDARAKRWSSALMGFKRITNFLDQYPEELQAFVRPYAARAALEMREFADVEREIDRMERLPIGTAPKDEIGLARARLSDAMGSTDAAMQLYQSVIANDVRPYVAEAMLYNVEMGLREKIMQPKQALEQLEMVSAIWRGDETEIRALGHMGRLYADAKRWREAFQSSRRALQSFPNHEITRVLGDEMSARFEQIFLQGQDNELSRLDALALYYDFKEFTPIGRRGDEMIRRLADRMLELDLLDQAADLLQYQVDNRLSGAARATIAARLASIRLMSGKPTQAVQVLDGSRLPELPKDVLRARQLLEARALSDLSRTDLAIEMLEGEKGSEVDRLRADIYWNGRRWREAGEAFETLLEQSWVGREPLTEQERRDALRAAIAYSLADELLPLDRLRSKFATKMADSEDSAAFAFLTTPHMSTTRQFKDITRQVASADMLSEFFTEYRKRYPDAAVKPRPRRPANDDGNEDALPAPPANQSAAPNVTQTAASRQ